MSRLRRHRSFVLLLSAFALFAQVLLPVTHAMVMAQLDAAMPNLVFCAPGTDTAKPELSAAITARLISAEHGKALHHKPACSICASAHAAQLAVPPTYGTHSFHAPSFFVSATRQAPAFIAVRLLLPPSRGPPRIS